MVNALSTQRRSGDFLPPSSPRRARASLRLSLANPQFFSFDRGFVGFQTDASGSFDRHCRQVQGGNRRVGSPMSVAKEYREFAEECLRWAADAHTQEHRTVLVGMAKTWGI